MNTRYKILGINDDKSECQCCGKQGLQKVVWIEDTETGDVGHFGCVCACKPAKAFGATKTDLAPFLSTFKRWQQRTWLLARKIYKEAGGVMIYNPDTVSLSFANPAFYEECLAQAVKTLAHIKPARQAT